MMLSQLRDVLIAFMDAGIAVVIESPPGRGKSTFMRQLVSYLSHRDGYTWGYQYMLMAAQTPTEMQGYQFKGERWWDDEGRIVKPGTKGVVPTPVTEPSLPPWMLTEEGKPLWAHPRGILVLEEWGQGEGDVKRVGSDLLLNGRLGPFRVPGFNTGKGWGIIALTNASTHRSGVTKEFDLIINRVAWIKLTDDIVGTENALAEFGVLPPFLAFAHQHPEVVLSPGVPEKQGPWMTPRTLHKMNDFCVQRMKQLGTSKVPTDSATLEGCAALVGMGAAELALRFARLEEEVPDISVIVADPNGAPLPESLDARYLICFSLAHRVTEKNAEKVLIYVDRLGKEFAVTFAKAVGARLPMIVLSPVFTAWAKGNSSLMALMQQFK
jgi:hypothetical protein